MGNRKKEQLINDSLRAYYEDKMYFIPYEKPDWEKGVSAESLIKIIEKEAREIYERGEDDVRL